VAKPLRCLRCLTSCNTQSPTALSATATALAPALSARNAHERRPLTSYAGRRSNFGAARTLLAEICRNDSSLLSKPAPPHGVPSWRKFAFAPLYTTYARHGRLFSSAELHGAPRSRLVSCPLILEVSCKHACLAQNVRAQRSYARGARRDALLKLAGTRCFQTVQSHRRLSASARLARVHLSRCL